VLIDAHSDAHRADDQDYPALRVSSTPSEAVIILLCIWALLGWNDHYCFTLQRTALLVCRSSGIPEQVRFLMLPRWYRTASPTVAAKWAVVLAIGFLESWWAAILMALAHSMYSALAPTNHRVNLRKLRKAVSTSSLEPEVVSELNFAMDSFVARTSS